MVETELARFAPPADTILTVGVFDGVHLGHRHLMEHLKRRAHERGLLAAVLTFPQHPRLVLQPDSRLTFLVSVEERLRLLRELGLDLVAVVSFTPELAGISARDFVSLLVKHLKVRGLVLGPDFALGRGREGDAPHLDLIGQKLGFSVETVAPLMIGGQVVSSTAIRQALAEGDMATVSALLGRNFTLKGLVVPGDQRGRLLGFPTANLGLDAHQALPGNGVYAARAQVGDASYLSAAYVGRRPTFGGGERMVEAFLMDFQGDIYGQPLTLEMVTRLRPDAFFATPGQLQEQMARDVARAREILLKGQPVWT